ncbi:MAG: bifunctional 4-hydroxy-2-oxoglutarate aldolase/2-dehydro-3-deoxy-phosphogluconate aldolase [Bacteroidia bacterium]|nr:bifunctional 4-hydroxy-2-oxoglutarate aldolase/2-dehydro-3-deoxy-phosphogluconate aldolase [Bacteroidia bacterium]
MSQFNIRQILERNKVIPVVTINELNEIDQLVAKLQKLNISCIEVTLRTEAAFDSLEYLMEQYGEELEIGVGTVVNRHQLLRASEIGVDFIVSPGLMTSMSYELEKAKTPFIPGVVTPSEIMEGLDLGYDTFKLFPAELVGGTKLLKTYNALFPGVKFCPTGGITKMTYLDYLDLPNVISVGGSWLV